MSYNQKLNAISRIVILLTFIGSIIFRSIKMFITGIITLGILVFLYFVQNKKNKQKCQKIR